MTAGKLPFFKVGTQSYKCHSSAHMINALSPAYPAFLSTGTDVSLIFVLRILQEITEEHVGSQEFISGPGQEFI